MIDALGFKGIWGDPKDPSTRVLESLKRIGEAAEGDRTEAKLRLHRRSLPDQVVRFVKNPDVKIVQLSDSIVVAAGRELRERALRASHAAELEKEGYDVAGLERAVDGYMRYLVCRCVSRILRTAALCDPALTYRGVVTFGRFAIDANFLLGPAVDEAASLMEVADGPFVWLAPTALWLPHYLIETTGVPWKTLGHRYPVPLKGGQEVRTRIVNPFAYCEGPEERERVEKRILKALTSPKVDVFVKRENTRRLFEDIAVTERMAVRAAERRAKKALADAAATFLAAAPGETAPAGKPPQVVGPAQPSEPGVTDKSPTPPGQPPTEPAE